MSIYNMIYPSSSTSLSDVENHCLLSPTLSSLITDFEAESLTFPSFVPVFPYLPNIRVPPPLVLPEIPLRERRGFLEFIHITPGSAFGSESQIPAKGQLEPRAGSLPRRRRASTVTKPISTPTSIHESRTFDFAALS
ncbi:hypothetical protein BDP27DRAFT_1426609 [Rhodocollybia butyracea]|uniref:Uncharacterized protein n=1 Tax=Rhodocollybia butyracea TaxID=206335 RepID=A0A9P5PEC7_9AGAR|nr:hypothetical protein BDP27DRAFT_1426609 [Rhodocollybia butyracea]